MVKLDAERSEGKIAQLFPKGYGFIVTSDGREVYFHHDIGGAEVIQALKQTALLPQEATNLAAGQCRWRFESA